MKIKNINLIKFRRFESLQIADLPPAKLVVMAGPNGSGKTSLLDAFSVWRAASTHRLGKLEEGYHQRAAGSVQWNQAVKIDFHSTPEPKKSFYLRTAHRNDPDFKLKSLSRMGSAEDENRFARMIEGDVTVSNNYQRLASNAFEDLFESEEGATTVAEFREKVVGDLRDSILRLFPNLLLNNLGNPLGDGTFRFTKGSQTGFNYKNLSGGEKAAFDLILDLIVKRRAFDDTVYAIDEPETHMNTALQGALLEEMLRLIPDGSQLWIATHSIGMMRKARDLYLQNPDDVVFLDFGDRDFDKHVSMSPEVPSRSFWSRVLNVALADLADLVAPREVVICEGSPTSPTAGKNAEHDAICYSKIFEDEYPDISFISAGSSKEVQGDRLKFAAAFPKIVRGISVRRVIDRDDHSAEDAEIFLKDEIQMLRRRNIESYLYDEEVLRALYDSKERAEDFSELQAAFAEAMAESVKRGNPADNIKSAASSIYIFVKKHLNLTACGDDQTAFARAILAPLIHREMVVYKELRADIFGAIG